jgi:ATP-dependent Lon protease
LLAAKRNKIETVLIPKENEIDLSEISEKVKDGLNIIPIEKLDDAIAYVIPSFGKNKSAKKSKKKTAARKK